MTDAVFIDPPSADFFGDRLFDTGDARLNRDGTLEPYARLRARLAARGIACHTADLLRDGRHLADNNHYWSLGAAGDYSDLIGRADVHNSISFPSFNKAKSTASELDLMINSLFICKFLSVFSENKK